MASALQLFNFHQAQEKDLPVPQTYPKKRKRKVTNPIAKGQIVKYSCPECAAVVDINTNAPVQCSNCNNRVVDKLRTKEAVTYDAI